MNRKQDPDLAKIIYLILKCPNTLAGRNEVGLTAMRPVVVDPNIKFTQLARELTEATTARTTSSPGDDQR